MQILRVAFLALVLGGAMVSQTLAHSLLKSSSPMDGAALPAPEALTLTFNEPVRLLRVSLIGPDGEAVLFGFEPNREPAASLRYGLPSLAAGQYRVEWTLIGVDGHTVSEQLTFSVIDSGT